MTIKAIPKIEASRPPETFAFEADSDAIARWNVGIQAAQTPENTINILDVIGADMFGDGITARRVSAALRRIGDQEVFVDVNSPGGDFFEGVAIYNMLREHPQKVTVRVLGLAASAASLIAMAGDEIRIGQAGFLMIHNAWVVAMGNRHDMAQAAEVLAPFDDAMASVYAAQAGVEKAVAAEWMDNERWFNGSQAVDAGLATELLASDEITETQVSAKAQSDHTKRDFDRMLAKAGVPRAERRTLLNALQGGTQDAAATVTRDADDSPAADIRQLIDIIRS